MAEQPVHQRCRLLARPLADRGVHGVGHRQPGQLVGSGTGNGRGVGAAAVVGLAGGVSDAASGASVVSGSAMGPSLPSGTDNACTRPVRPARPKAVIRPKDLRADDPSGAGTGLPGT
ncbi:hypothetical protein ACFQ0M_42100 [Kitasatospora aburaviensis]